VFASGGGCYVECNRRLGAKCIELAATNSAILPNRTGAYVAVDAEHMRLSIDDLKPLGGLSKLTASVGVESSCAKLSHAKALIAAADEAMYVSKCPPRTASPRSRLRTAHVSELILQS
jgi:GGDEF domain-containing protein